MIKTIDKVILIVILLVSIAVLFFVFISEFVFGFESCLLCQYQRIPYFAVILFAGLALHIKIIDQRAVLTLIGIIFVFGAAIAVYHVGTEQHLWNAATCGAPQKLPSSFESFKTGLNGKIPKRCDEINWTFLGLSMAAYNILFSTFLALLCFAGDKCCWNIKLRIKEKD